MEVFIYFVWLGVFFWKIQSSFGSGIPDPIYCHSGVANQWVQIGNKRCFCKEFIISTWPIVVKKYLLVNCEMLPTTTTVKPTPIATTTEKSTPATTTTQKPNRCPSPYGYGEINFRQGTQVNFVKKITEPHPKWTVSENGRSVASSHGSYPTAFMSFEEFEGLDLNGQFTSTEDDDDYMGFVFGFVNAYECYVASWRTQDENGSDEGFTIQRIQSVDGWTDSDDLGKVLWHRKNTTNQAVTIYRKVVSWKKNEVYSFELKYRPVVGLIRVKITDALFAEVVDTEAIYDEILYTSGGKVGGYTIYESAAFNSFKFTCNATLPGQSG